MMLTRAGDYALRSMVYLAKQPEGKITILSEIAEKQDVPKNFLAKILQVLTRAGLVKSHQGVNGGYSIEIPLDSIDLKKVIETVEGPIFLNRCLIREGECDRDSFCPIHDVWVEAQSKLMEVLTNTTLEDVIRNNPDLSYLS